MDIQVGKLIIACIIAWVSAIAWAVITLPDRGADRQIRVAIGMLPMLLLGAAVILIVIGFIGYALWTATSRVHVTLPQLRVPLPHLRRQRAVHAPEYPLTDDLVDQFVDGNITVDEFEDWINARYGLEVRK